MAFAAALRGEELALKDDAEEAVILGLLDLEKRLRREDTSVVEQHVETTESVDRRFHDGFASRRQSNIASMHDDTLARRVDLARDCLGLGTIAAVDDNRPAFGDEPGRDLFANPRSAPGDEGNLILETHSHFSCGYLPIGWYTIDSSGDLGRQYLSINREESKP